MAAASGPDGAIPCPDWGTMTPADLLAKRAAKEPDKAFFTHESGETLSYWQMNAQVDRLATLLRSVGLRSGDCVLVRQGRRVEGLVALFAAGRAGLDACIVPETMSARDACHGARALLPKAVIEAGEVDPDAGPGAARIMDIAAGLFTVRFAAGFGTICDGMMDIADEALIENPEIADGGFEAIERPADKPAMAHALRAGASGRVDRISRPMGAVLSQALAVAMTMKLSGRSVLGLPYDPAGAIGYLCAAVPCLLVGARIELFNPLDPLVADTVNYWSEQAEHHVGLLPHALFSPRKASEVPAHAGRRVWVAQGAGRLARGGECVLIDLGGYAYVPARPDKARRLAVAPGTIELTGLNGTPMDFGKIGLLGQPGRNSSASLMAGEITIEGPLAAHAENGAVRARHTGVLAQVTENDGVAPVYTLTAYDQAAGPLVGGQPIMMAAINRSLSLTGRWEDAAAFSVPDPLLGNRIEVAIEPRLPDGVPATRDRMPTLDDVRGMLADSGIGDAGLPTRLHLVLKVLRGASGQVMVDALKPFPVEVEAAPATDAAAAFAAAE